jgi:hypothetical protein
MELFKLPLLSLVRQVLQVQEFKAAPEQLVQLVFLVAMARLAQQD